MTSSKTTALINNGFENNPEAIFHVRNGDGQIISRHLSLKAAEAAAKSYRLDRELSDMFAVFGPVAEGSRQ